MYIDFPEGRLKFFGTLMFPSNKYMVLRFTSKNVLCEDIFENMVGIIIDVSGAYCSRLGSGTLLDATLP